MALLDLSLVTQCLLLLIEKRAQVLIKEHIKASTVWPAGTVLKVSPEPPDRLTGRRDVVGLYLYHVIEDAHFKNAEPPGRDTPAIPSIPMGLDAYYLLTAHSDQQDDTGTRREQLMFGLSMKVLHDCPILDDTLELVDTNNIHIKILDQVGLAGAGNRFRIDLQPIPADHAVTYWTAGSSPLRLAAYYQVSVVLLEPEEAKTRPGRVLVYGVHTFPGGLPRLDGSRNVASFQVPKETAPRQVELQPAQAPPAPAAPPIPDVSQVSFLGSNITGNRTRLLLANARWAQPVEVDAAWQVAAAQNSVTAVVRATAGGKAVIPGVYGAVVGVTKRRTMSDGAQRDVETLSNQTPFVITPRLDTVVQGAGPAPEFTVTGYLFQHAELKPEDLQLFVAETRLMLTAGANPGKGQFVVDSASTLRFKLPSGLTSGDWLPLRLFVNGGESLPSWIKVP